MEISREGGFLIAKIHQVSGRIFADKLKEHQIDEINPSQGRILFALWQKDGISIQELGERTSLEKSTLTSMLDRLEGIGYLRRVPSPDDRRKILIFLTEKNKTMKERYEQVSNEMLELFYRGFSEDEIQHFEEDLRKVLANLVLFEKS
ncbi:MAG TPA: MarR family transcriptional regulator [Bacillota bacterium]|nr:MarR family transcriptional regulator [Bacillota bacterium]